MLRVLVWLLVLGLAAVLAVWWLGRGSRLRRRIEAEAVRARRRFEEQRSTLDETVRVAADLTGKPRGLRWERVELHDEPPTLATDAATGDLYALASAEVAFSAIEGGGMEEVEAVGDVRAVTAVLVWRDGGWRSDGRVVFNHSPEQTLTRYADTLNRV